MGPCYEGNNFRISAHDIQLFLTRRLIRSIPSQWKLACVYYGPFSTVYERQSWLRALPEAGVAVLTPSRSASMRVWPFAALKSAHLFHVIVSTAAVLWSLNAPLPLSVWLPGLVPSRNDLVVESIADNEMHTVAYRIAVYIGQGSYAFPFTTFDYHHW